VKFESFGGWKIERGVIFLVNLLFKIEIVKLIDIFYGLDFPSFVVATNAANAADVVKPLDFSGV